MQKVFKTLTFVIVAVLLISSWCDPGTVDYGPDVCIIDPMAGEIPIGVITISATIVDNLGITSTALYIDGAVSGTHSSYNADTFYFQWDASNEAPESEHEIEVRATDTQNQAGSDEISVYMGEAPTGTVHEGTIDVDETWSASGNPHFIPSYLNISNGATVTVGQGCRIRFTHGAFIDVQNAALIVSGTSNSPVLFTSADTNPAPGSWGYIEFKGGNGVGSFNYCSLEYGGGSFATVYVTDSATVNMTNSVIRESLTNGFRTIRSGAVGNQFTNNIITTCNDYPLNVQAESIPFVDTSNTFTGNAQHGIQVSGGIVTGTVTWHKHIVPYYISEPIYCGEYDAKGVLIIESGANFKMGINGAFFVGAEDAGGMIADGTGDRITFTSAEITPSPGDWNCIYFYNNSLDDSCVIKNCNLEYGGATYYGIIHISDASPTIFGDSIGYSSSYGIYLEGETPDSTLLQNNNTFYDNASGAIGGP
ncbi:MAG: hypothetical protein GF315_00280 [candidate division Zixibacteria bacterium]|nr:hypothetical protein [candidate division Zixibacteria bacterium]